MEDRIIYMVDQVMVLCVLDHLVMGMLGSLDTCMLVHLVICKVDSMDICMLDLMLSCKDHQLCKEVLV
jgi:hypothetical protein